MMVRLLLAVIAVPVIIYTFWGLFIRPTHVAVRVNNPYPESLRLTTHTEQKLFGQKDSITGTVKILEDDSKGVYVRIENFLHKKTFPACPNMLVLLSLDLKREDSLILGKIDATEGAVNFMLPPKEDYKNYTHLMLWCESFGSDYAHASINREGKIIR